MLLLSSYSSNIYIYIYIYINPLLLSVTVTKQRKRPVGSLHTAPMIEGVNWYSKVTALVEFWPLMVGEGGYDGPIKHGYSFGIYEFV